jgi:hypothetical protein
MNWLRRLFGRGPAEGPVTPPEPATFPEGTPAPPESLEVVREEAAQEDWQNEGGAAQEQQQKSDREEFFSNQEQIGRPDDQTNGEKASDSGSNPNPSI